MNRLLAIIHLLLCQRFVLLVKDKDLMVEFSNGDPLERLDMLVVARDEYLDAITDGVEAVEMPPAEKFQLIPFTESQLN